MSQVKNNNSTARNDAYKTTPEKTKNHGRLFWMKLHAVISGLMLPALLLYSLTGISLATGLGEMPKPGRAEAANGTNIQARHDGAALNQNGRDAAGQDKNSENLNVYYRLQLLHKAKADYSTGGAIMSVFGGIAMLTLGLSGYVLALKTKSLRRLTIACTVIGCIFNAALAAV
jgi:hypothetical protein